MANTSLSQIRYQRKTMATSDAATSGVTNTITALQFNNLVIGQIYRITILGIFSIANDGAFSDNNTFRITNNGMSVCETANGRFASSAYGQFNEHGASGIFTATATTLVALHVIGNSNCTNYLVAGSYVELEEMNMHVATTAWT